MVKYRTLLQSCTRGSAPSSAIREIPPLNHLRIDTTRQREYLVAEIEDTLEHLLHRMSYEHRNSGAQ